MSRIIEPIGIKPEAIRVALHRLRNDGWITSEKHGRTSSYALAPLGQAETTAATPRIYARKADIPVEWHIVALQPMNSAKRTNAEKPFLNKGYVTLGNGVFLGKGAALTGLKDVFTLSGQPGEIPGWLKAQVADPWKSSYAVMAESLAEVEQLLSGEDVSDLEAATLRTLIVHNWRRILLNHPDLPEAFYPEDWKGFECRNRVLGLLDQLGTPNLQQLEQML